MDTPDRLDLLLEHTAPDAVHIDDALTRDMDTVAALARAQVAAERPPVRRVPRVTAGLGLAVLLCSGAGVAVAAGGFTGFLIALILGAVGYAIGGARDGEFDLSYLQPEFEASYGFVGGISTHADRLNTIRSIHESTGVLIDPHTADGVKVAQQYVEPGIPMLVLETALPAKFSETIEQAIGKPAAPPANLRDLASLEQRVEVMDCDAQLVRRYIEQHAA